MKNILTIIKKEFARFFKDRRMVITVFLPGLLIFVLYSLMGTLFTADSGDNNTEIPPTAYVIHMPESLEQAFSSAFDIKNIEIKEDKAKEEVGKGEINLLIVFPENFSLELKEETPDIRIYYNSGDDVSYQGYMIASAMLSDINKSLFTINASADKFDLIEDKAFTGQILSMLIPMLMFALLASSCVAVAPESIAGEKERGTMATMLITPVKRWQIAIGKIISLSCFALLSGISSFLGVIFSLPKLMGGFVGAETAAMYPFGDYMLIFAIIISVVLVIISAFSVMSALAKSVKEAGTLIAPLMIIVILLGMASMFVPSGNPVFCLIPLLGSGLSMSSIMSFNINPLGIGLSILSNLVITAVFVVLLAFMFNSEKIMFKK